MSGLATNLLAKCFSPALPPLYFSYKRIERVLFWMLLRVTVLDIYDSCVLILVGFILCLSQNNINNNISAVLNYLAVYTVHLCASVD